MRHNRTSYALMICMVAVLAAAERHLSWQLPEGQGSSTVTAPSFRSRTSLVLVPVVVQRSGQAVVGLPQNAFSVFQDGRPQAIASFEEIATAASVEPMQPTFRANQSEFANIRVTEPSRFTIIAIGSSDFASSVYARRAVIKYLEQSVPAGESIALVAEGAGGLRLVHDFDSDPAELIAALKRVATAIETKPDDTGLTALDNNLTGKEDRRVAALFGRAAPDPLDEFVRDEQQCVVVEAVRVLARAYGGLPGRKSLVWVGSSAPFGPPSPDSVCAEQARRAVEELVNANMAVYPVDARGLISPGGFDQGRPIKMVGNSPVPSDRDRAVYGLDSAIDAMNWIAEATGGRAMTRSNDLWGSIRRAVDDSAHSYLIGYYLPAKVKPGWHRIAVKVSGDSLQVRARGGVIVSDVPQPGSSDRDTARVLASPLESTDLPIVVRWVGEKEGTEDKKRILFNVAVLPGTLSPEGADHHIRVTIVAVASGEGQSRQVVSKNIDAHLVPEAEKQLLRAGLNYDGEFSIGRGRYIVKFAVQDSLTGRIGSVAARLMVE